MSPVEQLTDETSNGESGTLRESLNHEEPWKDEYLMHRFYHEVGMTYKEISEYMPVTKSSVHQNARKMGISRETPDPEEYDLPEKPYKDRDLMRELYVEEVMSTNDIAALFDCSPTTVSKYLDEHGIEKRSSSIAVSAGYGNHNQVPLRHKDQGYEIFWADDGEGGTKIVWHHRLMMVAERGLHALRGMDVHHKNEIKWDNRFDNLELVPTGDHRGTHSQKVTGLDRLRIAEFYENGEASSYELAEMLEHDISATTVRDIHAKYYGGKAGV